MKRRKKSGQRRGSIVRPAAVTLCLSAFLLVYSHFGGEGKVQHLIESLAQNDSFVSCILSLETGVLPDNIQVFKPNTASAAQYENADSPAAESTYIAPGENDNPILVSADKAATVTINNDTSYSVDVSSILAKNKLIHVDDSENPQVLIVHTHGSESYTPDAAFPYTPTENERTTDTRYNIVRVGDELASVLENKGIKTVHIRDIYDTPTYSGSYDRSLEAINKALKQNPSIQVVIDLHRDSIITNDGKTYKTSYIKDGAEMAQLMFVVGTNEGGLPHDNWQENLNYIASLQSILNREHSGLMRPINLRTQRFNQHASVGSMLVEVGSSGNTLTEALNAIRIFGDELADSLNNV